MSAGVPKMERLFHCSQGLIASLVWTHNSESLCVFAVSRLGLTLATFGGERMNFPIRPLLADRP